MVIRLVWIQALGRSCFFCFIDFMGTIPFFSMPVTASLPILWLKTFKGSVKIYKATRRKYTNRVRNLPNCKLSGISRLLRRSKTSQRSTWFMLIVLLSQCSMLAICSWPLKDTSHFLQILSLAYFQCVIRTELKFISRKSQRASGKLVVTW